MSPLVSFVFGFFTGMLFALIVTALIAGDSEPAETIEDSELLEDSSEPPPEDDGWDELTAKLAAAAPALAAETTMDIADRVLGRIGA